MKSGQACMVKALESADDGKFAANFPDGIQTMRMKRVDALPGCVLNQILITDSQATNTGVAETYLVQVSIYHTSNAEASELSQRAKDLLMRMRVDLDGTISATAFVHKRSQLFEDKEPTATGQKVWHAMNEFEVTVYRNGV